MLRLHESNPYRRKPPRVVIVGIGFVAATTLGYFLWENASHNGSAGSKPPSTATGAHPRLPNYDPALQTAINAAYEKDKGTVQANLDWLKAHDGDCTNAEPEGTGGRVQSARVIISTSCFGQDISPAGLHGVGLYNQASQSNRYVVAGAPNGIPATAVCIVEGGQVNRDPTVSTFPSSIKWAQLTSVGDTAVQGILAPVPTLHSLDGELGDLPFCTSTTHPPVVATNQ